MRKNKLISNFAFCGLLLATGVSHAQSSVTLYGLLDTGVEFLNHVHAGSGNQWRMQSGNVNGSRWGVLGTEDLGGGNQVIFRLESGLSLVNGSLLQGNREFGRQAMVGIRHEDTTLSMGRIYSPLYDVLEQFDPTVYAQYSLATMDPGLAYRSDNAVRLTRRVGPFQLLGQYSFGVDGIGASIGKPAGSESSSKDVSAAISYASNGLSASVIYDEVRGPLSTTNYSLGYVSSSLLPRVSSTSDRVSRYVAAAKFKLSSTELLAGYRFLHARIGTSVQNASLYWVGARQRIGARWTVAGGIYHSNVNGINASPTSFVLENYYFLSKRTSLYLNGSYMKNTSNSNLGVDLNGVTISGVSQLGLQAGIEHRF